MSRTDWISWAFEQKVPAGEKLLLLLLASRADARGVGSIELLELGSAMDYEARSLQRLRKSLRDLQLLREEIFEGTLWFALGKPDSFQAQPFPPKELAAGAACPAMQAAAEDAEQAGEILAGHVQQAADQLVARMTDLSRRLLEGMERLVLLSLDGPSPAAPPDPVLLSRPYQAAVARGVDEETAYALARELLEQFEEAPAGSIRKPAPEAASGKSPAGARQVPGTAAVLSPPEAAGGRTYPDDYSGRAGRVWDILHDKPPSLDAWADILTAWKRLEDAENSDRTSGTVEGETAAFELLYPAIVSAAQRVRGTMPMREFLDPKAIAKGMAPWDRPAGASTSERALEVELATMLGEIEAAAHPRVALPERVVEPAEAGQAARTENLKTFYLRVKRVHQQLRHLQQMGV